MLRFPFKYRRWAGRTRPIVVTHIIVWLYSIGLGLIPLVQNSYQSAADGSCFVGSNNVLGNMVFYQNMVVLLWCTVTFIFTAFKLRSMGDKKHKGVLTSLAIFVLAYLGVWFFPTLVYFLHGDGASEMASSSIAAVLVFATAISISLRGFVNFLVWQSRIVKVNLMRGKCGGLYYNCQSCLCPHKGSMAAHLLKEKGGKGKCHVELDSPEAE
jgi:hypothetical protein